VTEPPTAQQGRLRLNPHGFGQTTVPPQPSDTVLPPQVPAHAFMFGVHLQAPLLQVLPLPGQGVPSGTFWRVSEQVGAPVEHEVVPTWQGFDGVQGKPAVQHAPFVQTLLVQMVPQPAQLFGSVWVFTHV
jgi:hypothetical protein